jgi:CHAT domain-containing protein/tetratricopeptide (TPR) repeat protein
MRAYMRAAMNKAFTHVTDLIKAGKNKEAEKAAKDTIAKARHLTSGRERPPVARAYALLSRAQLNMGKTGDAEQAVRKAIAIFQKTGRSEAVAKNTGFLGLVLTRQGRHAEAEKALMSALATLERDLDHDDSAIANVLRWFAFQRQQQGRLAEAEGFAQRALVIYEKASSDHRAGVARTVQLLGLIDIQLARFADAEERLKRALAVGESVFGPQHWELAQTLRLLGQLYSNLGRNAEAEPLLVRAVDGFRNSVGLEHTAAINAMRVLGGVKMASGDFSGAEQILRSALAVFERARGSMDNDNVTLTYLHLKLGHVLHRQGRIVEASQHIETGLEAAKRIGEGSRRVADALMAVGRHYLALRRFDDARPPLQQARAIYEKSSPDDIGVVWSLRRLAELELRTNKPDDALRHLKRIVEILDGRRSDLRVLVGDRFNNEAEGLLRWIALAFARVSWKVDPGGKQSGSDAFIGAQYESQSTAAAAIAQMATRFAASDDALGQLVRKGQDLLQRWQAIDRELTDTLTEGADKSARGPLRAQLDDIGKELARVGARIATEFPQYEALTRPRPLSVPDVQNLMEADEAILFFLTGDYGSFVWALSKERIAWRGLPLGRQVLEDKVRRMRKGLDIGKLRLAAFAGKPELFDLGLAHELFSDLIAPVADVVRNKRHLLVVPSGPLTSLPFNLLLTEAPAQPISELTQIPHYRDASWLIKQHAITVLPSVASLQALRQMPMTAENREPFVGFGDPVFGSAVAQSGKPLQTAAASRARSYSSYWRGGAVNLQSLSSGLAPLPETAEEVRAVAKALGASATDIHLGAAASETAIKRADLSPYRVVYFATHGLVAGELESLAEPALAFSTPVKATTLDDGLLASSEVAQLKLNADWVVLSACNTAAGEKTGAEAFSGLARAFFYAGARSLLVSHWPVDSDAAVQLTTRMFEARRQHQGMGRAEALRQSMLAYMNDTSEVLNAYPAFWAPFTVVGEGGG